MNWLSAAFFSEKINSEAVDYIQKNAGYFIFYNKKPDICFGGFEDAWEQRKLEKLQNVKKSCLEKMFV